MLLVAHFVEGDLVSPLVMARAVKLHPALVAAGVLAVERLLGLVGLLVAVPVLVTVKILVEEVWIRAIESEAAASGEETDLGLALETDDAAGGRRIRLPHRHRAQRDPPA
jgi:predicted PurR-regulated permease PerM